MQKNKMIFIFSTILLYNMMSHFYPILKINYINIIVNIFCFFFLYKSLYPLIKKENSGNNHNESNKFFENNQHAVAILNLDGSILEMNKKMAYLINQNEKELKNSSISTFFGLQEDTFSKYIDQALIGINNEIETDFLTSNQKKYLMINFMPIFINKKVNNLYMIIKDITEEKQNNNQITSMAFTDSLTGLPNRMAFKERLKKEIEDQNSFALLFIDLDRFKLINDILGHNYGDQLLIEVAKRFKNSVRNDDIVARLGGDEFTIITNHVSESFYVEKVAQRIINSLRKPFIFDDHQFRITGSVGIVINQQGIDNENILMQKVDKAMYQAKSKGKNTFHFYSEIDNQEDAERKWLLSNDIYKAIDNNEFFLAYQPQIRLKDKEIVGMEALVRWNHQKYGTISPEEFIPLAEESGNIITLGKWIMKKACEDISKIHQKGKEIKISVNVSKIQFLQHNFVEEVRNIISNTKINPSSLELEITESMTMDVDYTMGILNELKEMNISICIDDFGTGYSSLSYLKQLPIDRLKIPKCFIDEIGENSKDAAIVNSIIDLAHNLKMPVIAEGVENKKQLYYMEMYDCDEVQGHLYYKSLTFEEIENILFKNVRS